MVYIAIKMNQNRRRNREIAGKSGGIDPGV